MDPTERSRSSLAADATDGQIVTSLREEGNIMAFEMLMKRYQGPVFGFILRQIGDRGKAEDLFQETFLQAYRRIDSCDKPDSFKPWTFAIASNLCKNETRRQVVRNGERPQASLNGHAGADPGPEGSALASEVRGKIKQALEQLVDAQREVFILYHYTKLSYDEIAEALNVPVGTVKSRMNAALTSLRSLLSELREK